MKCLGWVPCWYPCHDCLQDTVSWGRPWHCGEKNMTRTDPGSVSSPGRWPASGQVSQPLLVSPGPRGFSLDCPSEGICVSHIVQLLPLRRDWWPVHGTGAILSSQQAWWACVWGCGPAVAPLLPSWAAGVPAHFLRAPSPLLMRFAVFFPPGRQGTWTELRVCNCPATRPEGTHTCPEGTQPTRPAGLF